VILTEIGESLFHQFTDVEDSLEKITQFVSARKKSPEGNLFIISTFSIGEVFLIPYLAEFLDTYPHINLHLNMVDTVPNLSEEKIDIAFGFPPERMGLQLNELRYTKLVSFQRKLYASKAYLTKYGLPKNLKACRQHNYIFSQARAHDAFLEACKKNNIIPRSLITTNSLAALAQGGQSGLGLVSLPEFFVKKMPEKERLVEIPHLVPVTTIDTYLYYRNLRYIDPKIICFKNFFKEKLVVN
jgi:DNA-binding transcriptional LysR family regulator